MNKYKILIAVLTTGSRHKTFNQCLNSLLNLSKPLNSTYEILVVENTLDANEHVQLLIEQARQTNEYVHHIQVKQLGIPFARNGAVEFGIENEFSHLAFIDDDAIADSTWIRVLTEDLNLYDIVTGPQIPLFSDETKDVYKLVNIYKERNIKNNSILKWAATNNILLSLDFLKKNNLSFNASLIYGGEDKALTYKAYSLGARIQWKEFAIVREYVSLNRMNLKWIYNRSFRIGATGFLIESSKTTHFNSLIICLFKSCCYLVRGFLTFIPYMFFRNKTVLNSVADIAHGLGFLKGLLVRDPVGKYY